MQLPKPTPVPSEMYAYKWIFLTVLGGGEELSAPWDGGKCWAKNIYPENIYLSVHCGTSCPKSGTYPIWEATMPKDLAARKLRGRQVGGH